MKPARNAFARDAIAAKGWWSAHRWLLLRRSVQLGVLALFLAGPWLGWWVVKGNLNYSLTLDTLPLADPLVMLQSLLTGHVPERNAIIGVAIVLAFYLLVGGRVYCAWVCPVNIVTDAASALRRRLDIRGGGDLPRQTRYWMLALILALAAGTGSIVWELVSPVSLLPRGLIFGMGGGWLLIAGIFLFDLFVMKRGWCGHLCPVGAFYGLIGRTALVRVSAMRRSACDDCMDCFVVCPEPQVIRPALKQAGQTHPLILSGDCTNCGRCIDVCDRQVFKMTHRFDQRSA